MCAESKLRCLFLGETTGKKPSYYLQDAYKTGREQAKEVILPSLLLEKLSKNIRVPPAIATETDIDTLAKMAD